MRDYYRVPAKRGGRVIGHYGPGRITGFTGQYLRVRFDRTLDARYSEICHPTWCMRYLDDDGNVIHGKACESCEPTP